ncbi:hypothetical protein [Mucilaginibacter segetis]|uniref:Lipoprotein n=1 Tax=Mucilaginibacter segetis TaxID=2793071 RepID=A0A934UNN2_9SPHI|nr:hypothetical protein [Mucilaginibacter segetis]MBK0380978.1 hypothetical protein [Mucilaginibacter segetis]
MKRYLYILVLGLASCAGNNKDNSSDTDTLALTNVKQDTSLTKQLSTPAQNMEYCFIRTEGTSNQDTTAIHLVINADKVSGDMLWLPKEKDSRKGTLLGKINGNKIDAVWTFMQEGMKDTLSVDFKLSAQQLVQKPFTLNTATGRQQTNENADYSISYNMDNCEKFRTY